MKKRTAPDWDSLGRQRMFIPLFVYGREDIDVGPFQGFCRGHGAITGDEKSYQDTIGIYTAEGVYYRIVIDTRVECAIPTFAIDDKPFYYPIVACSTMCGGLPVIDPATGKMKQPQVKSNDKAWAANSNSLPLSSKLKEDALKADGFSAAEIASIREYVDSVDGLDNMATLVQLNGRIAWVCKTIALAIRAIRPEAYLGTASEIGMPQNIIDEIQEASDENRKEEKSD